MKKTPKIGLFISSLLEDEWNKDSDMRPKAVKAVNHIAKDLKRAGAIVNPGLIENHQQAQDACRQFVQEDVDAVLIMQLSYTQGLIPLRALKDVDIPIIIWNTQLLKSVPADARWDTILGNSGVTGITELTSALVRIGKTFHFINGHFGDDNAWRELSEYAQACQIKKMLHRTKVGIIGHPYKWMTDLMVNQLDLLAELGVITDYIEQSELASATEQLEADKQVDRLASQLSSKYNVQNLDKQTFLRCVRYSLALEKVVAEHGVDGLAFFEQGLLQHRSVGVTAALGMSRLFAKSIPCTSEADILTVVMMLIQQHLAGASTFLEHYGMDFEQNAALMAHDSLGNMELAGSDSSVTIEPTIFYEGTEGFGAALRFSYQPGDVTLSALFVGPPDGSSKFRFITTQGVSEAFTPRPIPAPQMLFKPDIGDINAFYRKWCCLGGPHHLAGCYGRYNSVVEKLANILNIDCDVI